MILSKNALNLNSEAPLVIGGTQENDKKLSVRL